MLIVGLVLYPGDTVCLVQLVARIRARIRAVVCKKCTTCAIILIPFVDHRNPCGARWYVGLENPSYLAQICRFSKAPDPRALYRHVYRSWNVYPITSPVFVWQQHLRTFLSNYLPHVSLVLMGMTCNVHFLPYLCFLSLLFFLADPGEDSGQTRADGL